MSTFIVPLSSLPTVEEIGRSAATGKSGQATGVPFQSILNDAIGNIESTNKENQSNTHSLAIGQTDELHTGGIAAVKSQTALSFASNITNAAIKSYNELLRMQV